MKIAFATDNGSSISQHLGRANYFEVIDVENGSVTSRERRDKPVFQHQHNNHDRNHEQHQKRHEAIAEPIKDCNMVVARGMGFSIFNFLTSLGITPIVTTIKEIDDALSEIVEGTIQNHTERLH